jgi:prolipoprotein diacylglyceryltransferase
VVVYLAGVALTFWLGYAVCGTAADHFSLYPSAFFALVLVAAVTVILGSRLEEKYVWAGWFKSSKDELRWIGRSHSSLLTSAAPAPLSLGLALGFLSVLVV